MEIKYKVKQYLLFFFNPIRSDVGQEKVNVGKEKDFTNQRYNFLFSDSMFEWFQYLLF